MQKPQGPIALLLKQVHILGATIQPGWILHSERHASVDTFETPLSHLKIALRKANIAADFWVMPLPRKAFYGHPEVDVPLAMAFAHPPAPPNPDSDDTTPEAQKLRAKHASLLDVLAIGNGTNEEHIANTNANSFLQPLCPQLSKYDSGYIVEKDWRKRVSLSNPTFDDKTSAAADLVHVHI